MCFLGTIYNICIYSSLCTQYRKEREPFFEIKQLRTFENQDNIQI